MKNVFYALFILALGFGGLSRVQAQGQDLPLPYECVTPLAKSASPAGVQRRPGPVTPSVCMLPYYIKVNVHYILSANGTGNFNETDDGGSANARDWNIASRWLDPSGNAPAGLPLPAVAPEASNNGYSFAQGVVWAAIMQSETNPQMQYPVGNTTPNPPKGINYVLGGVYFHRDDDFAQYNPEDHSRYPDGVLSTAQFDRYGVNKANEINIFLMGQVTKPSITPAQPRWIYNSGGASGFGYTANANWLKLGNIWRVHLINRARNNSASSGGVAWSVGAVLNHEVGHLLGLGHPFDWPQCGDTPMGPAGQGNNLMDYGQQLALTPCQINLAHAELNANYGGYYSCDGCRPPNAFFSMPDTVCIDPDQGQLCPLMLDARGSFAYNSYAYSITEVDANNQPIRLGVQRSGSGELGVACVNMMTLRPNTRYEVTLTVTNSCRSHSVTKYVSTRCSPKERPAALAGAPVQLYPNPATAKGFSIASPDQPTQLPIVRDAQGRVVGIEQVGQRHDATGWRTTYRLKQLAPQGLYLVEVRTPTHHLRQRLAIEAE